MSRLLSGYINPRGDLVIPTHFRTARRFKGGVTMATPLGGRMYGALDDKGAWLMEPRAAFYDQATNGVWPFNVGGQRNDRGAIAGGQWGWVGHGELLCPERFENVGVYKSELIAIKQGGRWGYADLRGNIRIAPQFQWAEGFSKHGLAAVGHSDQAGYIRPDGTWALPAQFEDAREETEQIIRVRRGGQWFYANLQGTVLSEGYDDAWFVCEGVAKVKRGDKFALLDAQFQVLGGHWFDEAELIHEGAAPVRKGDQWFLMDTGGNLHGPYSNVLLSSQGLSRIVGERGVGCLNARGEVVIDELYSSMKGFRDDWAAAKRDGKWTFIDKTGREMYPPRWDDTLGFDEGVAPVRQGDKWGVIDKSGELVAEPKYASVDFFSEGLATVQMFDLPTSFAVPGSWHCTPKEGLGFRGFEGAGAGDEIRVTICFEPNLNDDQILKLQQVYDKWATWLQTRAIGQLTERHEPWFAPYAFSVRFKNAEVPVPAAQLLIEETVALELPIKEVTVGRFRKDPNAPMTQQLHPVIPAVPHPDDPHGETMFPTFDAYLAACFDLSSPPPRSESFQHLLAGRWLQNYSGVAYDERIFTLHDPEVRICYGVTQEGFVEDDARTQQIAETMIQTITQYLGSQRVWNFPSQRRGPLNPRPLKRDGNPGVERLIFGGRTGYLFGVEALDIMQDIGPQVFRFRDVELFEAICAAVKQLGLAPVVTWQRFGQPLDGPSAVGIAHPFDPEWYIMNLWER